tara:strand:+ start:56133 stop:56561 length:429 start_codon:yes stop_codon:yes gene_type:complete
MGKENQYKAIPSSVHLERGYCCNNGCVNCPYKKALDLKSAYEKTGDPMVGLQYVDPTDHPNSHSGCPSHDSYTEEMERTQNFTVGEVGDAIADRINDRINVRKADADRIIERMNKKVSAAFTKGLIVGAILAALSIIAGFNF